MTAAFLARLNEESVAAAARERDYRKSSAEEIARLETERAYAYRRMNLLRSMATIAETGKDPEASLVDAQLVYLFRDLGWIGGELDDLAEGRKAIAEKLRHVAEAILNEIGGSDPAVPADMLFLEFEAWYRAEYGKAFLDAYETYVDDFMYPDA